ncbi:MAG: YciI family protein [Pseudomonadota bacterium]
MPTFIIIAKDKPDSLPLRKATRPSHLQYLKTAKTPLRLGGPVLSILETDAPPGETPFGSVLIIEADSIDEAREFSANDPYTKAGLFESVEITRYEMVAGDLIKK